MKEQTSEKRDWYKNKYGIILAVLILPFFAIWYVWRKTSWDNKYKWFVTVGICVLMIIALASSGNQTNESKRANMQTKDQQVAVDRETKAVTSSIEYTEADKYQKAGDTWKLIVVSKKPTDTELKQIATEIHSKDASSYFHIFDNNEKLTEYKNWDINYGKVVDKDGVAKQITDCNDTTYCSNLVKSGKYAFPAPESWMGEHELGLINQIYSEGGMKWQLSSPIGEKISDL